MNSFTKPFEDEDKKISNVIVRIIYNIYIYYIFYFNYFNIIILN